VGEKTLSVQAGIRVINSSKKDKDNIENLKDNKSDFDHTKKMKKDHIQEGRPNKSYQTIHINKMKENVLENDIKSIKNSFEEQDYIEGFLTDKIISTTDNKK